MGPQEILKKYITDEELLNHSTAVADLVRRVCEKRNMPTDIVEMAHTAGLLHDIGKTYNIIPIHPQASYQLILKELGDEHRNVAEIAQRHHQFQRSPYIMGLPSTNDTVQTLSEIVALCDKYEAYITRSQLSMKNALIACLGEYDFRDELLGALYKVVHEYHIDRV